MAHGKKIGEVLDHAHVRQIISAVQTGYMQCLMDYGKLKPCLSMREAYKMYGQGVVERWIDEGLVKVRKDGTRNSKCRIDRIEIASVAMASNRASWFENHE